ncbi:hypothetical protein RYA05_03745 [Pseudomonas syringae pv. actinidiae]|nr:hypothetical protein [Pseudomonas syringae pv. actinidiae]
MFNKEDVNNCSVSLNPDDSVIPSLVLSGQDYLNLIEVIEECDHPGSITALYGAMTNLNFTPPNTSKVPVNMHYTRNLFDVLSCSLTSLMDEGSERNNEANREVANLTQGQRPENGPDQQSNVVGSQQTFRSVAVLSTVLAFVSQLICLQKGFTVRALEWDAAIVSINKSTKQGVTA